MKEISILSIKIRNFRSIVDDAVILPQTPGLRFLSGENKKEENLGANGAGKSSLVRAIRWCLYGEGRTSQLMNWNASELSVEIQIMVAGKTQTILRTSPPGKVFLNSQAVEQPTIDMLIGLTRERFKHSVIFDQGARLFPDLTLPERIELLEQVLNQEIWQKSLQTTSTEYQQQVVKLSSYNVELARVEGQLASLETDEEVKVKLEDWNSSQTSAILNLQTQEAAWLRETKSTLHQLKDKLDNFSSEIQKELAELATKEVEWKDEITRNLDAKLSELEKLELDANAIENSLSNRTSPTVLIEHNRLETAKVHSAIYDIQYTIVDIQKRLRQIPNERDFWTKSECPTCKQKLQKDFAESSAKLLVSEEATFQLCLCKSKENLQIQETEFNRLTVELQSLRIAEKDDLNLRNARSVCLEGIKRLEDEIKRIGTALERESPYLSQKLAIKSRVNPYVALIEQKKLEKNPYIHQIDAKRLEKNPYIGRLSKLQQQRSALEKQLVEQKQKVEQAQSKLTVLEFWKHGFKRIRLYYIQKILSALSIEINSAISTLGLVGWKVRLVTETETKSETVKTGVQILIQEPSGKETTWDNWSGGEAQRLRLAIAMGLGSLIQRASGVWWNLEIWDEPSTFLSTEGVEDLMETLDYRAEVKKKQVWVIDHVALTYGNFKSIWVVEKDSKGSKVKIIS